MLDEHRLPLGTQRVRRALNGFAPDFATSDGAAGATAIPAQHRQRRQQRGGGGRLANAPAGRSAPPCVMPSTQPAKPSSDQPNGGAQYAGRAGLLAHHPSPAKALAPRHRNTPGAPIRAALPSSVPVAAPNATGWASPPAMHRVPREAKSHREKHQHCHHRRWRGKAGGNGDAHEGRRGCMASPPPRQAAR